MKRTLLVLLTLIMIPFGLHAAKVDGAKKGVPIINVKVNAQNISSGTNYNMGAADAGTPLEVTFTIDNTGDAVLLLSGKPRINLSGKCFTLVPDVTGDAVTSLKPSENTTFTVRFDPQGAGNFTGNISIESNDPTQNPYTFTIKGSVKTEAKFRLSFDLHYNPYFYEPVYKMDGMGFNGSFMGGVNINQFTIGLEAFENYYSYTSQDAGAFKGASSFTRGTLNLYYFHKDTVEFKWGVGGVWIKSAYIYNGLTDGRNNGGVSFLFSTRICPPWRYIEIEFNNYVDLLISDTLLVPYYLGGIKLIFHPYVKWLNLYVEASGTPWFENYSNFSMKSGIFIWSVGVSIDKIFGKTEKKKPKPVIEKIEKIERKDNTADLTKEIKIKDVTADKKEPVDPYKMQFASLSKSNKNETVNFYGINFDDNSAAISQSSLPILDKLYDFLVENKEMKIAISGYAEITNDPEKDLKLSVDRVNMISKYLIKKGISKDRIKTLASGELIKKGETAENTKIKIKILVK